MRRYAGLRPSRGTIIPSSMREAVLRRDWAHGRCIGKVVGMPGDCIGPIELDHVRASGAIGRKSRTEPDNLVALCGFHHRLKTGAGRTWRPVLLAYLETVS